MSLVDLKALTVRELLALWAGTLRELRDRGVVRTFNNPIGDIAEELVARHYGGKRGSFSQKTWDVAVGRAPSGQDVIRNAGGVVTDRPCAARARELDATCRPCAPTRGIPPGSS